jgi:hypothetical protein
MADGHDLKPRLYRENCRELDITAIAREGALEPGMHCGLAGSLGNSVIMASILVPFVSEMGPTKGKITVAWPNPDRQVLWVVRRAASTGTSFWKFDCPGCRTLTRRLLVPNPEKVPGLEGVALPWVCGACWGVRYRDAKAQRRARLKNHLEEIARLEKDLAVLKSCIGLSVKEMLEEARKEAASPWHAPDIK